MRKLLLLLLSGIMIQVTSCRSAKESVNVLFSPITEHPPVCISMNIPTNHYPISCRTVDWRTDYFFFEDSSYMYYHVSGVNPNNTLIRDLISSDTILLNQRYNSSFNPPGDSLYTIICEGIDSRGLYWKDIHYIIPDSVCNRVKGRKNLPSTIYRRVSTGYSRVHADKQSQFNAALNSIRLIQIAPNDSLILKYLETNFSEYSSFRYTEKYKGLILDTVSRIDTYGEWWHK